MSDWRVEADIPMAIAGVLPELTEQLVGAIKETAPVGKGPTAGSGRDSIEGEPHEGGADITAVRHMLFAASGTKPHDIKVRNAKVLADAEGDIFGTLVHHPGTAPNDYIERGIEAAVAPMGEQLLDAVMASIRFEGGD